MLLPAGQLDEPLERNTESGRVRARERDQVHRAADRLDRDVLNGLQRAQLWHRSDLTMALHRGGELALGLRPGAPRSAAEARRPDDISVLWSVDKPGVHTHVICGELRVPRRAESPGDDRQLGPVLADQAHTTSRRCSDRSRPASRHLLAAAAPGAVTSAAKLPPSFVQRSASSTCLSASPRIN